MKTNWFRLKLVFGALLFCAFTVAIFYYQFSRMGQGDTILSWHRLNFWYLLLLVVCLPIDTCASALRIWLVCRVLKREGGYWTCLKSEWANVGLAMLTPTQTGGGFGQIYMLSRRGISVSAATTISLITFLATLTALVTIGLCSVFFARTTVGSSLSLVVWPMALVVGLMGPPLLWPGPFCVALTAVLRGLSLVHSFWHRILFRSAGGPEGRPNKVEALRARVTDLVYRYHSDAWRFVREGRFYFVYICLLSLLFFTARCFMAFFCLRFLGVEASSLGEVLKIQMTLLFVLYLAPTPGGSGIAELVSWSTMSSIIPLDLGAYYNLLWRTSTLYIPAVLGLLVLSLAILRDTGRLFRRRPAVVTAPQTPHTPSIATPSDFSVPRGLSLEGAKSKVRRK